MLVKKEKRKNPRHVNLVQTGSVLCGLNKYNIPFESSILHFQGRHLIIDWRKVKRYGYYQAEGHRGTEGDSWEGLPHNSDTWTNSSFPTVLAFEEIKSLR